MRAVFAEANQYLDLPAPPDAQTGNAQGSVNLAVPRKGYVLSTAAELYGAPLRFASAVLGEAAPRKLAEAAWHRLYARRRLEPDVGQTRAPKELAAWMVVGAWTVGVATGCLRKDATLLDAETWFLGDVAEAEAGFAALVPSGARLEAERALHEIADPKALRDLLPYILDPHGEGSRTSVRLRPETTQARARKRAEGVFYTPADVAGFMAARIIRHLSDDAIPLTVFDPACGSGVFLRAVLSELQCRSPNADAFDLACSSLYGTDIDPWAVSAAAFVVLADCFNAVQARGIAPVAAWHALRLNLAHVNALRLDPGRAVLHDDPERIARLACRATLKAGKLPKVAGTNAPSGSLEFQVVFPELAEGARIVIGNPPYANIGAGNDLLSLSKRFETFQAAPRPTSDMYPLFVEQMTRLTAPDAHGGAMVLPLSIACNTGRQFLGLRRLLARTSGHWRFAFFDREPHALFGEDVKTRNAIVLWTRQGCESDVRISTGPLRKWRGDDRARMLHSVGFTPMAADIMLGIPKIEGAIQAEALTRLLGGQHTLQHAVTHIGRATLSDAMHSDNSTVFVAATAYNFLSIFLRPQSLALNGAEELTENPMLALVCPSREAALQLFALLSSKVAFWWWHAHGDGFHVSKHIIEIMPVGDAFRSAAFAAELTRLGELLWEEVSAKPVISRNRGRTSLGFSAVASPQREKIDALLIEALGLAPEFAGELERFCEGVTNAQLSLQTEKDNQRTHAHEPHTVG
ncbi:Eco57I restriction-modification methylase domain-containing protein [Xanthomonas hortorum]|uniref:site-specific DNA-methyltransferase (adenine-specific) n=1 Tax=Xanthomonas hortorum TaxID=56454 RepID=A0AA47ERL7_9XANT|nr:N-6 DNA methylase [Xanthomonas hortorum]WAH64058.1 N-6 DNA methylase [Xanthomonas hortorum]